MEEIKFLLASDSAGFANPSGISIQVDIYAKSFQISSHRLNIKYSPIIIRIKHEKH